MFDFKDPAASFEKSCWNVTGSVDLSAFDQSTMFHQKSLKKKPQKHVISQHILLGKQLLLFKFFFHVIVRQHWIACVYLGIGLMLYGLLEKICVFTTVTSISHWTFQYFRSCFSHVALFFFPTVCPCLAATVNQYHVFRGHQWESSVPLFLWGLDAGCRICHPAVCLTQLPLHCSHPQNDDNETHGDNGT